MQTFMCVINYCVCPGVGDVFSRADNFSMRVWLQTDKLAQLGLTVNDVQNAINEQNLQVAAGSVASPPQNSSSSFEFTVFTNSRLTTESDFGNIVVRSNPQAGIYRVFKRCCTNTIRKSELYSEFFC